jgi:hypothetical protein
VSDLNEVIDAYLAMWNETDPETRSKVIEQAWTSDCRYVDPLLEAGGYSALSEMVDGVQAHYQGHRFRRVSAIDTHHDQVRFGWELVGPDGALTVAGIDVGELAADGRLCRITGFFGEIPQEEAS